MKRGVFWLIEDRLFSFPFDGRYPEGIAKSGNTYNHQKLWDSVNPRGCKKPFDWYPRGRVEITNRGIPVIYLSPHIGDDRIPEIKQAFDIQGNAVIRYDHSIHYHCHFD